MGPGWGAVRLRGLAGEAKRGIPEVGDAVSLNAVEELLEVELLHDN